MPENAGFSKPSPDVEAVWRLVDREVWIITSAHGGNRGGLVATWVARASLDPRRPLVLVALAASHFTTELVLASGEFAAHLLSPANLPLAWQFGLASGRDRDKFGGVKATIGALTAPILPAALAVLECRVVKRYDARERQYLWAEVIASQKLNDGLPLKESQLIAAASVEQREQLKRGMTADIETLAPAMASWLAE
jgi:flavin reductase (DIM6/NTAB) family NADH-FMN oxidoreductase RutF